MVFVFLSDLFYLYLACSAAGLPHRGPQASWRPRPTVLHIRMLSFLAAGRGFTRTESRPVRDRPPWSPGNGRLVAVLVPACYLAAALIVTWRLWADPASRFVAPNVGDADLFAWYLRYAASAVSHGHLPALVTSGMNAPVGVNLMWNTSLLLPGVLLAPVTLLLGPQVSLTVLTTAGFAGSATAMFLVLRRWRVSVTSSALAGAVYGFSPALLHSAIGHYNLQLAVLPPLIVDASVRLAVGPRPKAGLRDGVWLGGLCAAQLFISEEPLVGTALAMVLMLAVLATVAPRQALDRLAVVLRGLGVAAATVLVLAGYPLWIQFLGPLRQHGSPFPPDTFQNSGGAFVTPSGYLLFHSARSAAAAA